MDDLCDMTRVAKLHETLSRLSTYEQVGAWDAAASAELDVLRQILEKMAPEAQEAEHEAEAARREFAHGLAVFFMMGGSSKWKRWSAEATKLRRGTRLLELLVMELGLTVAITPDSPEDLKELLATAKAKKKEIQAEKREVNAAMREIRVDARQKAVAVPQYGSSSYRRMERRSIALEKEAALAPHEDEKSFIERRLLAWDQRIAWLEGFKARAAARYAEEG